MAPLTNEKAEASAQNTVPNRIAAASFTQSVVDDGSTREGELHRTARIQPPRWLEARKFKGDRSEPAPPMKTHKPVDATFKFVFLFESLVERVILAPKGFWPTVPPL